jgi:hypothetical protein
MPHTGLRRVIEWMFAQIRAPRLFGKDSLK